MSHLESTEYQDSLEDLGDKLAELKKIISSTEESQEQKSFWDIKLHPQDEYDVPWISNIVRKKYYWDRDQNIFYNCRLTKKLWSVVFENAMIKDVNWNIKYENHKETYYSQRVLPGWWLKIPWRHVAADWTVRDKDWYICVAANYIPKWSEIMTTLGPWKVYDAWDMKWKWIDIYVDRA